MKLQWSLRFMFVAMTLTCIGCALFACLEPKIGHCMVGNFQKSAGMFSSVKPPAGQPYAITVDLPGGRRREFFMTVSVKGRHGLRISVPLGKTGGYFDRDAYERAGWTYIAAEPDPIFDWW